VLEVVGRIGVTAIGACPKHTREVCRRVAGTPDRLAAGTAVISARVRDVGASLRGHKAARDSLFTPAHG